MASGGTTQRNEPQEAAPARVLNPGGAAPLVLVCEHASNRIPAEYGDLGLAPELFASHIAWDPGAAEVTERLAALLDAPAVLGTVSRLVFDCNRPPEAPDAIPVLSEVHRVPGNETLAPGARARRIATVHDPFRDLLAAIIAGRPRRPALVTIHSFTPVFRGTPRPVELGILHDSDARLADAMLETAAARMGMRTARNEPYGPADGVTHTLKVHGIRNGLANVMIEIRNDLIATPGDARAVADRLAGVLADALAAVGVAQPEASA